MFDGAGFSVKMIEVIPSDSDLTVQIIGRNPHYESYERPAKDIDIVGRVKAKMTRL